MNIQLITNDKKRFLSLLLLADEQESMIDRYLERGKLFVMRSMQEAEVIAVAFVTNEGNGGCCHTAMHSPLYGERNPMIINTNEGIKGYKKSPCLHHRLSAKKVYVNPWIENLPH